MTDTPDYSDVLGQLSQILSAIGANLQTVQLTIGEVIGDGLGQLSAQTHYGAMSLDGFASAVVPHVVAIDSAMASIAGSLQTMAGLKTGPASLFGDGQPTTVGRDIVQAQYDGALAMVDTTRHSASMAEALAGKVLDAVGTLKTMVDGAIKPVKDAVLTRWNAYSVNVVPVAPEKAPKAIVDAYTDCMELGSLAMLANWSLSLPVLGTIGIQMAGLPALIGQFSGFQEITDNVLGVWHEYHLGRPWTRYLNEKMRPWVPDLHTTARLIGRDELPFGAAAQKPLEHLGVPDDWLETVVQLQQTGPSLRSITYMSEVCDFSDEQWALAVKLMDIRKEFREPITWALKKRATQTYDQKAINLALDAYIAGASDKGHLAKVLADDLPGSSRRAAAQAYADVAKSLRPDMARQTQEEGRRHSSWALSVANALEDYVVGLAEVPAFTQSMAALIHDDGIRSDVTTYADAERQAYDDRQRAANERALRREYTNKQLAAHVDNYIDGFADHATLTDAVAILVDNQEAQSAILDYADIAAGRKRADLMTTLAEDQYARGMLGEGAPTPALESAGLVQPMLGLQSQLAYSKRYKSVPLLSLTDAAQQAMAAAKKLYLAGQVTAGMLTNLLLRANIDPSAVDIIVSSLTAQRRQGTSATAKRLGLAELRDAYLEGILTKPEFIAQLNSLGYPLADINVEMALDAAKLQALQTGVTRADMFPAYETAYAAGTITAPELDAAYTAAGKDSAYIAARHLVLDPKNAKSLAAA